MRPSPRLLAAVWLALGLALAPGAVAVEEEVPESRRDHQVDDDAYDPPAPTVVFRLGAAPGSVGATPYGEVSYGASPYMCLEVAPTGDFALEGCGTGSGFLTEARGVDVAHFRGKWLGPAWFSAVGWLQPVVFAGFAELEVGADDPGFDFGGAGRLGTETAGGEVGAALRFMTDLGAGLALITDLELGLMVFPHAAELILPQPELQPIGSLTVGVGW